MAITLSFSVAFTTTIDGGDGNGNGNGDNEVKANREFDRNKKWNEMNVLLYKV